MPPRCFLGCSSDVAGHLHVFPNPNRFPDQFRKWVDIIGGQLNTPEDFAFYRMKRLCDRHFTEKDRNRNNRLNVLAVPSLFLTGESADHVKKPTRAPVVLSQIDMNVPLVESTHTNIIRETELKGQYFQPATSSKSAISTEESITCSTTNLLSIHSHATEDSIAGPSLQRPNSPPRTFETHGAYTASGAFIFSEHNYSKPLHPKTNNLAALDLSVKKPSLSLKKYGRELRQMRTLQKQITMLRTRCTNFKNRLASAVKMSTDSAFQKVTKYMTSSAKLFTKMQFSQTHKKPSGRRFSLEEKILSLSLFKRSPKCYSLLAHCFTLPSKKTLKGILAQIKLGPGINQKIFEKLRNTVSKMTTEDRLCSVIFDEMSLTPQINYDPVNDQLKGFVSTYSKGNQIADHVLVFMIKGIRANFKQPVAYYFTNRITKETLKNLIVEVLQKVQATGLIPLCTVCDQSTVNVGAISQLVNVSKNFFLRQGKEWRYDFYNINKQNHTSLRCSPFVERIAQSSLPKICCMLMLMMDISRK